MDGEDKIGWSEVYEILWGTLKRVEYNHLSEVKTKDEWLELLKNVLWLEMFAKRSKMQNSLGGGPKKKENAIGPKGISNFVKLEVKKLEESLNKDTLLQMWKDGNAPILPGKKLEIPLTHEVITKSYPWNVGTLLPKEQAPIDMASYPKNVATAYYTQYKWKGQVVPKEKYEELQKASLGSGDPVEAQGETAVDPTHLGGSQETHQEPAGSD